MGILEDIFGGGTIGGAPKESDLDPNNQYTSPLEAEIDRQSKGAFKDTDKDGVDDEAEAARGLDPLRPDTDGDNLLDGQELVNTGYTARVLQYDGDIWAIDYDFDYEARSNPLAKDTDRDGLQDDGEFAAKSDPFRRDTDGDTLLDGAEVHTHRTDPTLRDTDGNQGDDNVELANGTNPLGSVTEAERHAIVDKIVANPDPVLTQLKHSITPVQAAPEGPNALRALSNAGVDTSNIGTAPPPVAEPGPNALGALTRAGVDTSNIGPAPQVAEPSPTADQPPGPSADDEAGADIDFGGGAEKLASQVLSGGNGIPRPDALLDGSEFGRGNDTGADELITTEGRGPSDSGDGSSYDNQDRSEGSSEDSGEGSSDTSDGGSSADSDRGSSDDSGGGSSEDSGADGGQHTQGIRAPDDGADIPDGVFY